MIYKSGTLNLRESQIGSSSCQCSTISIGQRKETVEFPFSNSEKVKECAKRFSQGHWTFLGPGDKRKWYGESSYPPNGEWDSTANKMLQRFKETGHLVFKSISALSRGALKRKRSQETTHFNGDSSNTELLFRIIHSVNQFSNYGAVTNWCEPIGLTVDKRNKKDLLKERIRDQRCIIKCEFSRSKTFGIFSKTSLREKNSGLRITVRDNSIQTAGVNLFTEFGVSGQSWECR